MNRPARIAVGIACSAAVVGLTIWGLTIWSDTPAPTPTSSAGSVNEDSSDPWHGVPACTDSIADAGGICHGEPIPDVGIPTSAPTVTPAPLNRGGYTVAPVEPPAPVTVAAAPPIVIAPPIVNEPIVDEPIVNEPTPRWANDWLEGAQPCAVEDDDNCYWDAMTMGNGQGWSFVTVDGVTHYPVLRDPFQLDECTVADDDNCIYRGVADGDRCDWVNAPHLMSTWFLNCDDDDLATKVIL
jgi:hypothetical protein